MWDNFLSGVKSVNDFLNGIVWGWPVVILILGTGILLTIRTKFLQVTHFGESLNTTIIPTLKSLRGGRKKDTRLNSISQFEAFSTAISGTVGTGNIVGVVSAILTGGPGAVFWMWISAFFGMVTNYSENVLSLYFRKRDKDGNLSGGAFYYIANGLRWKWLAYCAAVFCTFAAIGMSGVQTNKISGTMAQTVSHFFNFNDDWIVKHLAALVVDGHVLLQALRHRPVVDDRRLGLAELRIYHDLQDIQHLAGIAAAVAEERVRLMDLDLALLEDHVLGERAVQQLLQVLDLQGLEDEHLAAGQQGSDDLEGRVLRGGTDQDHGPSLHGAQEGVLLGLVEAVDLVDEKDGRTGGGEQRAALRRIDHIPHVLDARTHGGQGVELTVQRVSDDARERGLPHARRTPENEGRQGAGVHHRPEDASRPHEVALTDVVGQFLGPHPLRKRR